jgi:type IV secretion system protein VirB1
MRSAGPFVTPIQAGRFDKPSATGSVRNRKPLLQELNIGRKLGLCTAAIFATLSRPAFALPLSARSFDRLALSCAPAVERSTLRAVAAVESHFDPLAVRDNSTHESLMPQNLPAAVALARNRMKLGHSVDIGLMQINNANLATLGMSVEAAFDECRSLAAGGRILLSAFAVGSSESERQAAILISLSRYNTGRALAGIANGYANQVIAAQSESPDDKKAQRDTRNTSPRWDIWGTSRAETVSWVVTADQLSEFVRAGAQSSDARNEGRAPASRSEKGEPYEVFAYQESKPPKP